MTESITENLDPEPDHPELNPVAGNVLDSELVERYLNRAVEEYGRDYRDPQGESGGPCNNVYYDDRGEAITGRCIAAQVLSYHGVPDELLAGCDGNISETVTGVEQRATPLAMMILSVAQGAQDAGATWHQARTAGTRLAVETKANPNAPEIPDKVGSN